MIEPIRSRGNRTSQLVWNYVKQERRIKRELDCNLFSRRLPSALEFHYAKLGLKRRAILRKCNYSWNEFELEDKAAKSFSTSQTVREFFNLNNFDCFDLPIDATIFARANKILMITKFDKVTKFSRRKDDFSRILSNLCWIGRTNWRNKQLTFVPGESPKLLEERHACRDSVVSWSFRSIAVSRARWSGSSLRSPITKLDRRPRRKTALVRERTSSKCRLLVYIGIRRAVCEFCLPLTRLCRFTLLVGLVRVSTYPHYRLLQGEPSTSLTVPRACRSTFDTRHSSPDHSDKPCFDRLRHRFDLSTLHLSNFTPPIPNWQLTTAHRLLLN